MGERIESLETALATLQATISREPHPLLRQELLRVKSSAELHRAHGVASKSSPASSDDTPENEYSNRNHSDYHMSVEPQTPLADPYWCRTEQMPTRVGGIHRRYFYHTVHDHRLARSTFR